MSILTNVAGSIEFPRTGKSTGYNLHATAGSRTAVNANLVNGAVLMRDPHNHGNDSNNLEFALPTAGFEGALAVCQENNIYELGERNKIDPAVANRRKGGQVRLVNIGRARPLVKANCVKGVTKLYPVEGQWYLAAGMEPGVLASATAASAAVSNTASETTFDNSSYTIPANSLKVGDIIRIRTQGIATATNSTDTLAIAVKIGSTALYTFTANDVVNNDIWTGEVEMTVRSIGASGAAVVDIVGTLDVDADKDPAIGSFKASTTIDTTGDLALTVTATWSVANSGNSCRADVFNVILIRANTTFNACFAIADETVNNSAAAAQTYVTICRPSLL